MNTKIISLLLSFSLSFMCLSQVLTGKVIKIADGDSFTLLDEENKQTRIRLYGIDCPEPGQDFGKEATQFAASLIEGETVTVNVIDIDRYGRSVGLVHVGNSTLSEELLKEGLAWNYTEYNKLFPALYGSHEREAKTLKKGIWSKPNPVAPWDYRKGVREPEKTAVAPVRTQNGLTKSNSAYSNKTAQKKSTPATSSTYAAPERKEVQKTVTKSEAVVIICNGKSAYAYHSHFCRGLSRCKAGTSKVTVSKAINMGYSPCKICY